MTAFRPESSFRKPDQLFALVQASPLGRQLVAAQRELDLPVYLVGGCIRDWLLGKDPGDWDVVLPGSPRPILDALQAVLGRRAVVELDAELEIYRLQLDAGAYLDVARLIRDDLNADLSRRDLTINAMAVDLSSGELVDPLGGYRDLQAGVLRVPEYANIEADPVRILRVYRFAATLGFQPLPQTKAWLERTAHRLTSIAGERLLAEWHKLLNSGRAAEALADMEAAGVLAWSMGCPDYHSRGAIQRIASMEHLAAFPGTEAQTRLSEALRADSLDERPRRATFLMAALLLDARPAERVAIFERLTFSRKQTHLLRSILEGYARFSARQAPKFDTLQMYRGVRDMQDAWPGLMWLLAGEASETRKLEAQQGLAYYWQQLDHPPPRLIRGQDILALPGMRPGPEVADWLARVNEAIALGQLNTREAALEWLRRQRPPKT